MPMIVSQKKTEDFLPPSDGEQNAVCVDVVDLGMVPGYEGREEHKIRVFWELEERMEDGRPFIITQKFTVSLHKKANLYKVLNSWRGREFTEDELKAFDLEKLIGAPCRLIIEHRTNNKTGEIYAIVANILKPKEKRLKPSGQWVRKKDRDDWTPPKNSPWNRMEMLPEAPAGAEMEERPAF